MPQNPAETGFDFFCCLLYICHMDFDLIFFKTRTWCCTSVVCGIGLVKVAVVYAFQWKLNRKL